MPHELYPGARVELLGRQVTITGCADDEQTRGWLALMGLPTKLKPSDAAAALPEDAHLAHLRKAAARDAAARDAARTVSAETDELRRRQRNACVARPGLRREPPCSGKAVTPLLEERARELARFVGGPLGPLDGRVEVIAPSLAALLSRPARHALRDIGPLGHPLCLRLPHGRILIRGPRALLRR